MSPSKLTAHGDGHGNHLAHSLNRAGRGSLHTAALSSSGAGMTTGNPSSSASAPSPQHGAAGTNRTAGCPSCPPGRDRKSAPRQRAPALAPPRGRLRRAAGKRRGTLHGGTATGPWGSPQPRGPPAHGLPAEWRAGAHRPGVLAATPGPPPPGRPSPPAALPRGPHHVRGIRTRAPDGPSPTCRPDAPRASACRRPCPGVAAGALLSGAGGRPTRLLAAPPPPPVRPAAGAFLAGRGGSPRR